MFVSEGFAAIFATDLMLSALQDAKNIISTEKFLCSPKTILPTIHNVDSERSSCSTNSTCINVTKNESLYIALLQKMVEIIPHFRPKLALEDEDENTRMFKMKTQGEYSTKNF